MLDESEVPKEFDNLLFSVFPFSIYILQFSIYGLSYYNIQKEN